MRGLTSILYFLLTLGTDNSLRLEQRGNPAVVEPPFRKVEKITPITSDSESKRSTGPIEVLIRLERFRGQFLMESKVGTPPQSILAVLDTGSTDLVIHTTKDVIAPCRF